MKQLPKQWKNLCFWGVFFFILSVHSKVLAQDTLRIFYTSGEHKLYSNSKLEINGFIFSHDLKYVDSISLNGYTDSTGQAKKNQSLSTKRVATVRKYLYKIGINDSVPISMQARGEESDNENPNLENHRRVEVILHFTKSYVPPAEEEEKPTGNFVNSNCYISAGDVMSKANITYFQKGNSKYVKLEMEASQMNPETRFYSLTARNRYPKLLKWETVTTGYWWWKRPRYIATIKAKDYEKYGVVVLNNSKDSATCEICGTDPQNDWFLKPQLMPDNFVLQHALVKKRVLPNRVQIAVPKEYVSIGRGYYLDSLTSVPLYWTFKRTRNAVPFYYAEIPASYYNSSDFQIYSYRRYCAEDVPEVQKNSTDTLQHEFTSNNFGSVQEFSVGAEFAYRNYSRDEAAYTLYFQMPLNQFLFQLNAGFSSKNRVIAGLSADFHFLAYSFTGEYKLHSNPVLVQENQRVLTSYIGTSLTSFNGQKSSQLLNEYYLGLAFWNKVVGFGFDSAFIQAGVFLDLGNQSASEIFSLRTGLRFRIY